MVRRRPTFRRKRSLFAAALIAVALAAIAAGCTEDPLAESPRSEAGAPPAVLGDSVCPVVAPDAGEGCLLPEGTTCAFGACGSQIAECTLGAWRFSGNKQVEPPCPTDFPASQSVCPPCWPATKECTYGSRDCSAEDASANRTVASCVDGGAGQPARWALRTLPCAKPSDAGADVQGDADADAD